MSAISPTLYASSKRYSNNGNAEPSYLMLHPPVPGSGPLPIYSDKTCPLLTSFPGMFMTTHCCHCVIPSFLSGFCVSTSAGKEGCNSAARVSTKQMDGEGKPTGKNYGVVRSILRRVNDLRSLFDVNSLDFIANNCFSA